MKYIFPILLIVFFISCGSKKDTTEDQVSQKKTIAVVNYPLYFFAKSIGGEHVTVYFPVMEGDPAYWKPSAKQVINFQDADLILANGAGYAKWMEKVSLPSSKIVNTSLSFKEHWIETVEGLSHSHGPEGEHVHKGTAFTTWLNFKFALQQAATIHESMKQLLPERIDELNQNYTELKKQLEELDSKTENITNKVGDQYIIASHPVYQYLAGGYGLNIISEHWEPDEMPDKQHWEILKKTMDDHSVKIMLWEDVPMEEIKERLLQINLRITVFNTCANRPNAGDFIQIMNENISQLENALGAQ